jgi:hypothetical protein
LTLKGICHGQPEAFIWRKAGRAASGNGSGKKNSLF